MIKNNLACFDDPTMPSESLIQGITDGRWQVFVVPQGAFLMS